MYKLVLTTDNPEALLYAVGKVEGVSDKIKLKNLSTNEVGEYSLAQLTQHPVKRVLKAMTTALLAGAFTMMALISSGVLAFVFLYGLVAIFAQYDYQAIRVIAMAMLIALSYALWRTHQSHVVATEYIKRFEPEEVAYE